MNYNGKKLKGHNSQTGEFIEFDADQFYDTGPNIKGLSLHRINIKIFLELQKALGYKKNNLKVLEYILDNVDMYNIFKANITHIAQEQKIATRGDVSSAIKILVKESFLVPLDNKHTYQVNPFIYISGHIKNKNKKIELQREFFDKYDLDSSGRKLNFIVVEPELYWEYLKSDNWKKKQKEFIKQHPYCSICKSTEYLNVHHSNYKSLYDEKYEDIEILCNTCHRKLHIINRMIHSSIA